MFVLVCVFVQNACANQPIIVVSMGEKEQVYKIVELSTEKVNVLSSNSQIELIFSPIERLTLKDGQVVSYTHIKHKAEPYSKRVELEQSDIFKSKFDDFEIEIDVFSSTSKSSKIISIDSMNTRIEFINNKYILRFI